MADTDFIKTEPEYQTAEDSQVYAQADNESRLQDMMEFQKRANVYRVKSKDELFGVKPPGVTGKKIGSSDLKQQKRAAITDVTSVPTRSAKRFKAATTATPEVRESGLHTMLGVSRETLDTAAICVCVVAGVYLLIKWKGGKEVVETISEGSSIEV